jgi:hypothetical protein
MSERDVERFRVKASECHQQAERAVSTVDEAIWLRLANEWLKLVEQTERDSRQAS